MSVNKIIDDYPQLEKSAAIAKSSFNEYFGKAYFGIKNYLYDFFGQAKFDSLYGKEANKKLEDLVFSQNLSEEEANNFIVELSDRAKGKIVSPILETLLYFQFIDNPMKEFTTGFIREFNSDESPKSLNVHFTIKTPISWKPKESSLKGLLKTFTSDYGDGDQSLSIMIRDLNLPKEYKLTNKEVEAFFTPNQMKAIVPSGGKYISSERIGLVNKPAGLIHYGFSSKVIDTVIAIRYASFLLVHEKKLIMIQCSVGATKANNDLEKEMNKFLPLFKLIASSILIEK